MTVDQIVWWCLWEQNCSSELFGISTLKRRYERVLALPFYIINNIWLQFYWVWCSLCFYDLVFNEQYLLNDFHLLFLSIEEPIPKAVLCNIKPRTLFSVNITSLNLIIQAIINVDTMNLISFKSSKSPNCSQVKIVAKGISLQHKQDTAS